MKITTLVAAIISLAAAACCGVYLWYEYELWALAFYAVIIFALPFASVAHEYGHAAFGALSKIKAKPSFALFSPSCCEIVPGTDKGLKSRIFFTVAGGVFVNALFIISGIVALCVDGCPTALSVFMPSSLYVFILNVIPAEYPAGKTDGLILFELLKGADSAKVMLAVLSVQAKVLNGTPIGEVDESLLFNLPQIREDDRTFIALCELRYEYCEAVGDKENADRYKSRCEELKKLYL